MRGQPISAVLADVDGTLVNNKTELTPRTIDAVHRLHAHGVLFCLTGGRPPRGLRMLVEPLGMEFPMAAFNGGVIVLPDMTVADQCPVPVDVSLRVIDTCRAHGLLVWIYTATEWYVTDGHAPHTARQARTHRFDPTVVAGYDEFRDRIIKIVGVSDHHARVAEAEAAVRKEFDPLVSAARPQPDHLDVTHPDANKGAALERLSRCFEVPAERIATIGDRLTDVLMFRRGGLSVAMGNAPAEVRRQAAYVTGSNEEDGFATAMERYVLPRATPWH
ncbi:Cof subfamily protein (haloacid dehalogenase superfamily) [Actinoplanes octamycinicus]|uniref:Cof subfamily protein (Haloacid dehalogenase superfamily) n=1 Tax=Actinoplanes octamycinicus TaxID=135948 RepID=A0A7W7GY69_9ACTN|nr:Cof-type HAD-IIB family hydrolase [Actinoplanes octamycinicus]MBB4740483.1 Cof subfamily protein (haloacid dehalogenase superfamily) [Actinoplanes octamycinicus]GIE59743.1 haloacid dehalogenase [Actinoplanes octamycinicus]